MKLILKALLAFGLVYAGCQEKKEISDKRPNIVFLLADDLGFNELGSYGQKIIKTPHLDKLAEKSLRFTNFYAGNAVCAPSRAVLLTGKNSNQVAIRGNAGYFGADKWEGVALDKDEFTLGELMKGAGYQTGFIGKWHLDKPDEVETWACGHGFDYAAQEQWTARYGGRKFPPNRLWLNGDENYVLYDYTQHDCKDALRTNLAFEFLDSVKRDQPFFLFMSYRAPHSFEGPIRDTSMYAEHGWPEIERVHATKITLLDKQVGRLLRRLEELGQRDNTIIMFTSDNGPHFAPNGHDLEFFDSNGPLKGGKRDLYEGGVRVPLLVSWKDEIIENEITDHVSGFIDIMPTMAEIVGAKVPLQSRGISFLPLLQNMDQVKHESLSFEVQMSGWFQAIPDGGFRQSVRLGLMKAVRYGVDSDIELYDLSSDPSESINAAEQHPSIVARVEELFKTERTEVVGFPFGGVKQDYKSMDRYKKEK